MEPKFQSSFIPKGPLAPTTAGPSMGRKSSEKNLFSMLAMVIFIVSVLVAAGMFGFKYYLKYSIDRMGTDLEQARASLEPETIEKLTRLDGQISSAKTLVTKHIALTSLFEFLEASTPKTVRFTSFRYELSPDGLKLSMRGEARGYAALALQADIFSKSPYFKDPTFSELVLNQRGDVRFSFEAMVDKSLASYNSIVESMDIPPVASTTTSSTTSPLNLDNI